MVPDDNQRPVPPGFPAPNDPNVPQVPPEFSPPPGVPDGKPDIQLPPDQG